MTYRKYCAILAKLVLMLRCHFSHSTEDRVLTFQALMMQQERTLPELNFISHQQSSLDDVMETEEKKYFTPASEVKEESAALAAQKPSSLSKGRDPKQRQLLEDTFLGREISFPSKEAFQESDDGNSSLLDAARKTANLVESSTTFPPGMLTSHDAWYLTPLQQYNFPNNTIQEESIESILLAAAAALNLGSPETPKNEADEYIASVNAAQATSSSHHRVEWTNRQEQNSIPNKSGSPVLSQCSEKEKRHVDDRKPF
mmetsp:Transcript_19921/g.28393  ORF Transcript_19921/g.28393 Transcript_19921/m.28393 type:complete len:257 (-) Transcript_19921:224-994(-)